MNDNNHLVILGSKTAKDGFKNEQYVVDEFNNWKKSELSKLWLSKMQYNINDIEYVHAEKISGSFKADIQLAIRVAIKLKKLKDIQNIQVKLVSNPKGFNQIDKRWLAKYDELWNIPKDVLSLLQYYTGEKAPYIDGTRDKRRMFIDEFTHQEQELILEFIKNNKTLIVSDLLKGRGKFAAEWMLVILKDGVDSETIQWALEPINVVLNIFGNGPVVSTARGSIYIGKITMQRKGGDNGRATANMLQFKINPAVLVKYSTR
jgi:hypothetical protein